MITQLWKVVKAALASYAQALFRAHHGCSRLKPLEEAPQGFCPLPP